MEKYLLYFLMWIASIVIWIATFSPLLENYSLIWLLRLVLSCTGFLSFSDIFVTFIKRNKEIPYLSEKIQIISIVTASLTLFLYSTTETFWQKINPYLAPMVSIISFFLSIVNSVTLLVSIRVMMENKKFSLLFIPNLILSTVPLLMVVFLVLLVNSGFRLPG